MNSNQLSYAARAKIIKHPVAQALLLLMDNKKTNLALSADVTSKQALLDLAEQLGPEICILKTHIDIIEDFDQTLISDLKAIAKRHEFLIFEDRKFADIGNTVQHQYEKGIYHIADWADIINAHTLPGPSILHGLKSIGIPKQRACLLLAQMSSTGNLIDADYVTATIELAKEHSDFVIGFIAQERLLDNPDFIYMTRGVSLQSSSDTLGQSYTDPYHVIKSCGCDVIIVGRGIYEDPSPLAMAKKYRQAGWDAYQQRIS